MEQSVRASLVKVTDDEITVALDDGRTIIVQTAWYPHLQRATARERSKYMVDRVGAPWPDIDADFSIKGLLAGQKSGESLDFFGF